MLQPLAVSYLTYIVILLEQTGASDNIIPLINAILLLVRVYVVLLVRVYVVLKQMRGFSLKKVCHSLCMVICLGICQSIASAGFARIKDLIA